MKRSAAAAEDEVEQQLSFHAGRAVIGACARSVKEFLHNEGLRYEVEVDAGWPSGMVYITIWGPNARVEAATEELLAWGRRLEKRRASRRQAEAAAGATGAGLAVLVVLAVVVVAIVIAIVRSGGH